jgi:hypothetical protein
MDAMESDAYERFAAKDAWRKRQEERNERESALLDRLSIEPSEEAERRRVKDVWLRHLGLALCCAPLAALCAALTVIQVYRAQWWHVALGAALALWNARLVWKNLDAIRRWG